MLQYTNILEVIIMKAIIKFGLFYFLLSHCCMTNALAVDPVDSIEVTEASCEALLGPQTLSYLNTGFAIIQIIGVILVVILGLTDFMGAILAGDADANKKVIKRFIVRLFVMGILLVVPSALEMVLSVFGISNGSFCIL